MEKNENNVKVYSEIENVAIEIEKENVNNEINEVDKMNCIFSSHDSYVQFCIDCAKDKLSGVDDISSDFEDDINLYENIKHLEEPKNICFLDEDLISNEDIQRAKECILEGKFFAEHTAAGEATRLGLGTKYLLNPNNDLSVERVLEIMRSERGDSYSKDELLKEMGCLPSDLLSISLGVRHMLQFSFDIAKVAREFGVDEESVLKKQKMLVVLSEKASERIISEFLRFGFFGFAQENVMFMIQKTYHGLGVDESGDFFYDTESPQRLHNHGQLVMQETMDDEIFRISADLKREYLKSSEFGEILKEMNDKISYNIEDMKYLLGSIDFESLAFALRKGDEGYGMLMEIVDNNPITPQKGGMAAYDKKLGRNVMIESFQLKGIKNEDIKFLNKNFNHFPKPYKCWSMLKKDALNMPVSIKKDRVYFQPVQGDINFLVQTEFFKRKVDAVNKQWKSGGHTAMAIKYMKMQDEQEGFEEYAKGFLGDSFME